MKVFHKLLLTAAVAVTPMIATASEPVATVSAIPVVHDNPSDSSKLDRSLVAVGILDSDYTYKDIDSAKSYFNILYKNISQTFAMDPSTSINMIEFSLSPYYSQYIYKHTGDLSDERVAKIKSQLDTTAAFQKLCQDVYLKDRFWSANNHLMNFVYTYNDGEIITEVNIDSDNCK